MRYVYESFVRLKNFIVDVVDRFKMMFSGISFKDIVPILRDKYKEIKKQLKDLKGTNWDLAQYHFVAGNFNDGIMRFKMLQRSGYNVVESNYFLGRIYMEKENYIKAKEHLNIYLGSSNTEYRAEAEYCMKVMNNQEITSIPISIIKIKRNRLALNLSSAKIDESLLLRYYGIITVLKSYLNPSSKALEVGCYVGVFGRIFRETFAQNIQYFCGVEVGDKAAAVAKEMRANDKQVYDSIQILSAISDISNDQNLYSVIILPDILRYCENITAMFIKIFASLQDNGICVLVTRIFNDEVAFSFSHCFSEDENRNLKVVEIERVDEVNASDAPTETPMIDENNSSEENSTKSVFIGAIEEFSHNPKNLVNVAKSSGFQVKLSIQMAGDFALFVLQKS
jgi:2-polyprenyl-3-methyl-5-hydroxy-6-metoxy-1,4-benzoquinol methylase